MRGVGRRLSPGGCSTLPGPDCHLTPVTRSRLYALALLIVAVPGLWAWGLTREQAFTAWPVAWLHGVSLMLWFLAVFSDELPGRRAMLVMAALWSWTVFELTTLPLAMSRKDWLEVGQPAHAGGEQVLWMLQAQLRSLIGLAWWQGLWRTPPYVVLCFMPFAAVSLIAHGITEVLPWWSRRPAHVGAGLWLLLLAMFLGMWLRELSDVPDGVLLLGVVLWPLLFATPAVGPAGLLWAGCVGAALCMLGDWIGSARQLIDALFTLALLLTAWCWLVWWRYMNRIRHEEVAERQAELNRQEAQRRQAATDAAKPGFDLTGHLDSDQAQEGADKYTRE